VQLDTEYGSEKFTQSLINTQPTLANRITSIWQWKWGELPKQRQATQLLIRSTTFLSNIWPLRKKEKSTDGVYLDDIISNRCDKPSRYLSTM
jgi:hypothetical protein